MMRACHLNTCPVGIATQDPELRKRFAGQPEHVVNFFFYVAEEARQIMARLGIRRYEDLVGRVELLEADEAIAQWRERGLDLTPLLARPEAPEGTPVRRVRAQDSPLTDALDWQLIEAAAPALERRRAGRDVVPGPERQPHGRRPPLAPRDKWPTAGPGCPTARSASA